MSAQGVLQNIVASVRARLEERKAARPLAELERAPSRTPQPFAFAALASVQVIAEIEFTSPALGKLASQSALSPAAVAQGYLRAGAAAISILTEQDHFHGSPDYLRAVRATCPDARILMKDFFVDEYQLHEARFNGADAVLLIVALLGEARTGELLKRARALGLSALVEVHDTEEFEIARRVGAELIGVNNRNLNTLHVDLDTSVRLARLERGGARLVCESGLTRGSELKALAAAGYSAFLVGTSFMKTDDPGAALGKMLAEAR